VSSIGSAERRPPLLRVGWRPATEPSAADRLLADLVTWHVGTALPIGRRCVRCGSTSHGQPFVEADVVHLSLSRAPGLALAAVSTAGPVGVDVEPAGRARFPGFEDVAVHPQEGCREPTETWVHKEALLKATGWGLAIDPRQVWIDDDRRVVSWDELLPAPERWWLTDLPLTRGYVGAVAVIRQAGARAG
jgi:4'-phosphopantetheinyl transferase